MIMEPGKEIRGQKCNVCVGEEDYVSGFFHNGN